MAVVSASIACRSSRSSRSSPAGAAHGQVQVVQRVLSAAPRTRARLGSRLTHTGARSAATHSRRARAALAAATHWQQPHTGSSHTLAAATLQARAGEAGRREARARARARTFVHRVEAEHINPSHPLISVAWGAMTVRTRQPSPSAFTRRAP